MLRRGVFTVAILMLGACASSSDDVVHTQTIRVVPEGVPGRASCEVADATGEVVTLPSAPAPLTVELGTGPLTITCSKAGFKTATVTVQEEMIPADSGFFNFSGSSGTDGGRRFPTPIVVRLEPGQDPAPPPPVLIAPQPVVVTPPPPPPPPVQEAARPGVGLNAAPQRSGFSVQVGAFRDGRNATRLVESLRKKGYMAVLIQSKAGSGSVLSRVRVGQFPTYKEAFRAARRFEAAERMDAFPARNQ